MSRTLRILFIGASALALAACGSTSPSRIASNVHMTQTAGMQPVQNAAYSSWVRAFRDRAVAQGIPARTYDNAFRNAGYLPGVVERDNNQSEFTRAIWDYLDSAASQTRIETGRAMLVEHAGLLSQIEARYGVDRHIVLAVWGMESNFGKNKGDIHIISALSTLAFDGRRATFFEQQLIAALKILAAGDTDPDHLVGSWAGAMGHTQFMPTSYLEYAVDFTGDGKRDIWSNNPADALASTAAYLARSGWVSGQPWGVEIALPSGFNYSLAGKGKNRPTSEWAAMGVRALSGNLPSADSSVFLPAGANGPAFLITRNFTAISRYNNADSYVMGVGHLADRLRGGPAIQGNWPRSETPLKKADRIELQQRLTARGFDTQGQDGILGPNTATAIRAFQRSQGMVEDGYPSSSLLSRLR